MDANYKLPRVNCSMALTEVSSAILFLKYFLLTISVILFIHYFDTPAHSKEQSIKIALTINPPLAFPDVKGQARGIFVDVIEHVAKQEEWSLEYVPCDWHDCQEMLRNGKLDLMMTLAITTERREVFDFNSEPVFVNWAQVYRKPFTEIDSIMDLAGKKIASVKKDIYLEEFLNLTQSFDIDIEIIETDNYPEVFRYIQEGKADAGIVNRLVGLKYEKQFDVEKTSIIFKPVSLFFAATKNKNSEIISSIDKHLINLKKNPDSVYHQSQNKWLATLGRVITRRPIEESGNKPIVFYGDQNFPPIESIVAGKPEGLNIDFLLALSKAMHRPIEIRLMHWEEAQQKLLAGEADALTLLGPTKKRRELYDFTDTTLEFEFTFFIDDNDKTIKTIRNLEGKTVGVTKAGYPYQILQPHKNINFYFIKNNLEGFKLLKAGDIDAVATDKWVGGYTIQDNGLKGIKILQDPFARNKVSIAVKKGNTHLLEELNRGLEILNKNQIMKQIKDDWKPKQLVFFTRERIKEIIIVISTILILLIISSVVLWILVLRREVTKKTKLLRKSRDDLEMKVQERTSELENSNRDLVSEIVERKLAENTAIINEEKYRDLVFCTADWVWEIDQDGIYTYASEKVEQILGYRPDEIIGKTLFNLGPESKAERVHHLFNKIKLNKDLIVDFEIWNLRKNGEQVCLLVNGTPIINYEGTLQGYRGVGKDITEQKRTEEMLRESEKNFRTLFEQSSIAIFVVQDGIIKSPNPRALHLHGYAEEELTSKSFIDFIHPEDQKMVLDCYERRLKGKKPCSTYFYRIISKAGETRWVELNVAEFSWQGKSATLCSMIDISERKELEAQLQQSQKMEALGTLAGGIAHDFNNILTAIFGFTEMALNDELPQDSSVCRSLNQVLKAGHRAKDLVRQILAFSRHEEETASPVKIIPLVKEVLKLLRSTIPTTIEIRQDLSAKSDTVHCDPTRIHQVLMNLCTNAFQAMPQEKGVLTVNLTDTYLDSRTVEEYLGLTPGPYLRLSVSDTGRGIEPGIRDRIFEPYFTTKAVGEGTGLGLAVVHGIIKSLHGDIVVESELGGGSTFHILLPVLEHDTFEEPAPPEYSPGGNERILFIDDEAPIVEMREKLLEGLGYRVAAYTNPLEALAAFKASVNEFDLVMTDMTMPEMTGDVLAREIQKERPDIPIVLCTGYSNLITPEKAEDLGIKGFISKPNSSSEIALTIRRVLDNSKKPVKGNG